MKNIVTVTLPPDVLEPIDMFRKSLGLNQLGVAYSRPHMILKMLRIVLSLPGWDWRPKQPAE
jgi:hypothetical protein